MREECKHFQSRTYATGEVVRFCELDLAPEAPWRCPEDCPSYDRRLADVGWVHGSLVEPAIEDEPGPGGADVADASRGGRGHHRRRGARDLGRGPTRRGQGVAVGPALALAPSLNACGQRPRNSGGRLAMKAAMASTRSSDWRNPAFQAAT